jgi:tRNA A-37 threonylcarbamoyl transferase component Bud32
MAADRPVRVTAAGAWFLPEDGGAGSRLRVADGIPAKAVRRIRDLGVPGLLPIGNVVEERGQVWLRTPQPPGPSLADLPSVPGAGAVAVLRGVARALAELHARHVTHGALDADAVLLDQDGAPLLVVVDAGVTDHAADAVALAVLARRLAGSWCDGDAAAAETLRRCAAAAEHDGLDAALAELTAESAVPEPRSPADDRSPISAPGHRRHHR